MKFTPLLYIIFSLNIVNLQDKNDDLLESLDTSKIAPMTRTTKSGSSEIHDTKGTDFGSSKYDKEIIWAVNIDTDNVQGSLDRYREIRQQEDTKKFTINFLKVAGIIVISLIGIISLFQRKKYFK